ncbi:MAG: hypothetical protein GX764_07010 [Firmicutes bacterium]|jgi:hypothetical protein|nr:hypothetical protein [Bacillota bacterium]
MPATKNGATKKEKSGFLLASKKEKTAFRFIEQSCRISSEKIISQLNE